MATARYGRVTKNHYLPYGAMAGVSDEFRKAYYTHGYRHDEDWPDLPEFDLREEPPPPETVRFAHELQDVVAQLLETVTPREAKVLRMRFGIELREDYTLEAIGDVFGVLGERIRQIEARALRKLRYNRKETWQLAGFMEREK